MLDKVAGLIVKDGKLLLVREQGKPWWQLPGGLRKDGETDEQALRREISEELGTEVDTYTYFDVFEGLTPTGKPIRVTCYLCDVSGVSRPHSEIEEIDWVSEAPEPTTDTTKSIISQLRAGGLLA